MGGVVAFELARQLQRRGEQVEVLVLIDSGPVSQVPTNEEAAWITTQFILDLAQLYGFGESQLEELLAGKESDQILKRLFEEAQRTGA